MSTHARHLWNDRGYYYLATPYSKWVHGLDDANTVAQKLAARLLLLRLPIYCPIAHTHGIAMHTKDEVDARDHGFWMAADKPLFDAACGLLIADLPGWKESKGVQMEIEWCKEQKKPYWLLNPKTLDIRVPKL
jgi:hypothetical protein